MKILSPFEIKILVVVDNSDIRQATARLLGKAGYQVTQAAGGAEALAETRRQRPDLLLTDRDMPGMDGIEVCRQIKQNPDLKGCLVVMVSATYANTEQQSEGLESGEDGYIARPIANRELLARVDAFVRILSLTRSLAEHVEQLEKSSVIANLTQMASLNLMEDAVAAQDRLLSANQELQDEITERKQAEANLTAERTLLRTLVDNLPLSIYLKDNAGRKTLANPTDLLNCGMTSETEIRGKTDFDIFPPEQAALFDQGDQQVLKGQPVFNRDETVTRPDGTTRWILTSKVPLRDAAGQVTGLVGFGIDITERKQVEASHARLAMAVEQAAETIVITDAQGMILYANPAFEKTTGYTQAEALGQNPRVLEKSGKHDAAFYRQMWKTLLQGEVWSGHFLNKRKDGAMYQEEATISPIRNDEGKITNFVAVKRDVSREVQLERQITEIQKMEAIGQLAGGVAHDYNNILAATNIQLGMLMMDKTLTPEVLEALKDLRRGSDRAASLTRQLLLFSRRQAMQIKPVELNTLLDDVLKMIRRVIGEHIDLNIQSQTQAAWIEADSGMIEQVVMNLAINARDAMPNGGKLTIRINELVISPQDIRNPEARTDHFISLTVADEGCGMSEEIQSRIFEPFFTTKGVGKGTGLGLATVYGIVKQHRGWIEVSSKIGKGSVFQVLLPKGGSQTSVTAEHTQPPIMDGTGTILVVEDEDSVRRPLVLFLKLAGYQVFEAENGAEALKLWGGRLNLINLLLTDMVMPGGMNGKQLADSFKKSKPDLPVIITSGYSTEISNFGFNEEYGFRFLAKPYQTNALLKIVQQCLGSKK